MNRLIILVLIGMFLSFGLAGCIVSTSPGTSNVIEMRPGETKFFRVNGINLNSSTTKCHWYIYRNDGNSPEELERTDQIEFKVNPEGEKSNRVKIVCQFWSYKYQIHHTQGGPVWYWEWVQTDITTWNIRILKDTAPVWQGDYYIEESADMQLLSRYTEVTGSLSITDNNIENLSGLECLTSVGGSLQIENNASLLNLTGLENLTSIGGDLSIYRNFYLTNLSGLKNLPSVGGSLYIGGDNSLTGLSGLDNLTSIGGDLVIEWNRALTSLVSLENLKTVGGYMWIGVNDSLTSLSGLEKTTVGGCVSIGANPALTSLSHLENITSVAGDLTIRFNALRNLSGLENLKSVTGDLIIEGNYSLESLSGIENLTSVGGSLSIGDTNALTNLSGIENLTSVFEDLRIWNNNALTSLGMTGLQKVGSDFKIYDNPMLCNSLAEELMNQVLAGVGIGGVLTISGNKDCTTP